jgi:uncharacterized membrane protein
VAPEHLANVAIHVAAGMVAMGCGFAILAMTKGTSLHRRLGKGFSYFTLVVCHAAATGLILFRFLPIFAVLTLLVLYQLVSGWRSAHTKRDGPSGFDAIWTLVAAVFTVYLVPIVISQTIGARAVVFSTFGALATIVLYDTIRWLFPRAWHYVLWRYEHSYKLLSALFGMLSAFVGNVVRVGQPWSQLVPSAAGILVIIYFFFQIYRSEKAGFIQQPQA